MTDWSQPEAHITPDIEVVIQAADEHEPRGFTFMERFSPEQLAELQRFVL